MDLMEEEKWDEAEEVLSEEFVPAIKACCQRSRKKCISSIPWMPQTLMQMLLGSEKKLYG